MNDQRKVLITGAAGLLASELRSYLSSLYSYNVVAVPHARLDITRPDEVASVMARHRPDVVINTAVLQVEPSEATPEKAFAVNAWGARNLAQASQRHGAVLVQISTCGLFGDEIRPYQEYDEVALKTVYARSKYAGEQYVGQLCDRHFILRLGWLYGGNETHTRNFVAARYREARQKSVVQSASDKHGSPTYAGDVARAIPAILDSEQYGLYHVANQGGCTRAEYVQAIVKAFGLGTVVEEVDSSHFPRRAPVPDCEMLTSFNLGYAGLPLLPPWQEALARYVHGVRQMVQ